MKIGVGIIAFEEEEYIKSLLDNWYPYADNIVVMEGAWVSAAKIFGYDTSKDRTKEIVMEYPDPDKKIIFVHMSSSNQVSQLNYCYHHTLRKKPDWYVMSGADEFYHVLARCQAFRSPSCNQTYSMIAMNPTDNVKPTITTGVGNFSLMITICPPRSSISSSPGRHEPRCPWNLACRTDPLRTV